MNPFLPNQGPEFHERIAIWAHQHQALETLIALVLLGGAGAFLWWGLFS